MGVVAVGRAVGGHPPLLPLLPPLFSPSRFHPFSMAPPSSGGPVSLCADRWPAARPQAGLHRVQPSLVTHSEIEQSAASDVCRIKERHIELTADETLYKTK